ICYILFSLCLISCSEKIKLDSNSSFKYEDLNNSYDSKTKIFTRKYSNDTITVKIELTKNEKEKILQSFIENRFLSFPNEIDCSKWGVNPIIYNRLSLDSLNVEYIHNSGKNWLCPKGERFNKIVITIQDIILNKPEIKELELSD